MNVQQIKAAIADFSLTDLQEIARLVYAREGEIRRDAVAGFSAGDRVRYEFNPSFATHPIPGVGDPVGVVLKSRSKVSVLVRLDDGYECYVDPFELTVISRATAPLRQR